jgi:hypothetical protein
MITILLRVSLSGWSPRSRVTSVAPQILPRWNDVNSKSGPHPLKGLGGLGGPSIVWESKKEEQTHFSVTPVNTPEIQAYSLDQMEPSLLLAAQKGEDQNQDPVE